jgi:hypothetical protein
VRAQRSTGLRSFRALAVAGATFLSAEVVVEVHA